MDSPPEKRPKHRASTAAVERAEPIGTEEEEVVEGARGGGAERTSPPRPQPTVVPTHIQIVGLRADGAPPVVLASNQLHGNRQLLLDTPAAVGLYIRPLRRPTSTAVTVAWRLHNGKQFPDVAAVAPSSPTLLLGRVYPSLRHALVSLLLWSLGGMTGALSYRVSEADGFPDFVVENAELLGGPARGSSGVTGERNPDIPGIRSVGRLAVHLLPQEPSHAQLVSLSKDVVGGDFGAAVLLVGSLRPGGAGGPLAPPQIHPGRPPPTGKKNTGVVGGRPPPPRHTAGRHGAAGRRCGRPPAALGGAARLVPLRPGSTVRPGWAPPPCRTGGWSSR